MPLGMVFFVVAALLLTIFVVEIYSRRKSRVQAVQVPEIEPNDRDVPASEMRMAMAPNGAIFELSPTYKGRVRRRDVGTGRIEFLGGTLDEVIMRTIGVR